jgi:hypothetical protein
MRQLFETYRARPRLSALLAQLSWSHNLLIIGKVQARRGASRAGRRGRGHEETEIREAAEARTAMTL